MCNFPFLQVTEDTAKCLKDQKIHCTFRDTIPVKGKGQMPVYFVDLTDDLYISKEVEYGSVDTSAAIVIRYVTKYVIRCVCSL